MLLSDYHASKGRNEASTYRPADAASTGVARAEFGAPPKVVVPVVTCDATRVDGNQCMNTKQLQKGYCLGHSRLRNG